VRSIVDPAASGSGSLVYSTYLGGKGAKESGMGIGVDGAGHVYLAAYDGHEWSAAKQIEFVAENAPGRIDGARYFARTRSLERCNAFVRQRRVQPRGRESSFDPRVRHGMHVAAKTPKQSGQH